MPNYMDDIWMKNDTKQKQLIWFFQFIDSDKLGALEEDDLILCCEESCHLDKYTLENCIIGKSKNEAIDLLINYLNGMKNDNK